MKNYKQTRYPQSYFSRLNEWQSLKNKQPHSTNSEIYCRNSYFFLQQIDLLFASIFYFIPKNRKKIHDFYQSHHSPALFFIFIFEERARICPMNVRHWACHGNNRGLPNSFDGGLFTPTLAGFNIAYAGGRSLRRPLILICHILTFFLNFDLERCISLIRTKNYELTKKYAVNSAIFQQNRFHDLWSLQIHPLASVGVKITTLIPSKIFQNSKNHNPFGKSRDQQMTNFWDSKKHDPKYQENFAGSSNNPKNSNFSRLLVRFFPLLGFGLF